jgi:cytochrome c biogenesis protein CcmG/thiol:disulfide interchange protein DsbE
VVLVVVVGAITWVAVASNDDDGSSASTVDQADVRNGGPQVGDRAPDFTATTLDGRSVRLSDYAGQPVILNFWASWCNPCRQEFPLFRRQLARHGSEYVMLGVDSRDIPSDARRFVRQQHADWPMVDDSSTAVAKAYGVPQVPQTFFIKRDGTVAVRYFAQIPDEKFAAALDTITRPNGT